MNKCDTMNREMIDKMWEEGRIEVEEWTSRCNTTMFLHVFSRDPSALEEIEHEDYDSQMTFFGPAGFKVLYTHKDIKPSDYFFALIREMHADDSIKHKGCVEIMSKMTHIECDMAKIKEKFPYASIIDVEKAKGGWKNHEHYTIKLGAPRL